MTRKVYRTAQGKMVDLGALMLQNENVRAVGNMKVNARGDLVDSNNRPIDTRNRQVNRQYNRQTNDAPSASARPTTRRANSRSSKAENSPQVDVQPAPSVAVEIPPTPEDFDDNFVKQEPEPVAAPESSTGGGLAAAIAKARQIKQEPLKTPRQIAQENAGVKKI